MVGSTLEENAYHLASRDLESILAGDVDLSCTNVLLCAGGSNVWGIDFPMRPGEVGTFELVKERGVYRFKAIADCKRRSMGEYDVLSDFLRTAYYRYAADGYTLILWDHGGGPIIGFGDDTTYGEDSLFMRELLHALDESPFGTSNKLELIAFNACLMGTVEVAAALSPYARYMLASEESSRAGTWDFSLLGQSCARDPDPTVLMEAIATVGYLRMYFNNIDSIICGYDLSKAKQVCAELDSIFKKRSRDRSDFVNMSRLMKRVREVNDFGSDDCWDLYDVHSFAQAIYSDLPTEAKRLNQALNDMLIFRYVTKQGEALGGASFYFPLQIRNNRGTLLSIYKVFSDNGILTNYQKFIEKYHSYGLASGGLFQSGETQEAALRVTKADEESWRAPIGAVTDEPEPVRLFEVEVSPELQATMVDSFYTILVKEGKDRYRLLETGSSLTQNGARLQAALPLTALSVSGGEGTPWQPLAVKETRRDENGIQYAFSFLRTRDGVSQTLNATITLSPEHPVGQVTAVRLPNEGSMPNPIMESLKTGDALLLLRPLREIVSEDPAAPGIFEDWLDIPEGAQSDLPITVGKDGLVFSRQPLDPQAEYFVQLYVVDVGGSVFSTPLLPFHQSK